MRYLKFGILILSLMLLISSASAISLAFSNYTGHVVYVYTGAGTTTWTAPPGVTSVAFLAVAGGGNGGTGGGGGGAGGVNNATSYAVTPGNSYTVTVGAANSNSVFNTNTALAGGNGGASPYGAGQSGGSGGGSYGTGGGGSGTAGQGNNGGQGSNGADNSAGGGGGWGTAGAAGGARGSNTGGNGGSGQFNSITGSSVCYAGGGGGSGTTTLGGSAGTGGCGAGNGGVNAGNGASGTSNTGGGGGGYNGAGASGTVIISYMLSTPTASFTASPLTGITGITSIQFTDTSTGATPPINEWDWGFGDGVWLNGSTQNPTHTYAAAGTYSPTLVAKNSAGQSTVINPNYITISGQAIASFTQNQTSGFSPLVVAFTDTSSNSPSSWSWAAKNLTPGNNTWFVFSTSQNPIQAFNGGSWSINETVVKSGVSNISTQVSWVNVTQITTANFTSNVTAGPSPLAVQFIDQSFNATSWTWAFGDTGTSALQNPSHTYAGAGTYTVTHTAKDAFTNASFTAVNYITVFGSSVISISSPSIVVGSVSNATVSVNSISSYNFINANVTFNPLYVNGVSIVSNSTGGWSISGISINNATGFASFVATGGPGLISSSSPIADIKFYAISNSNGTVPLGFDSNTTYWQVQNNQTNTVFGTKTQGLITITGSRNFSSNIAIISNPTAMNYGVGGFVTVALNGLNSTTGFTGGFSFNKTALQVTKISLNTSGVSNGWSGSGTFDNIQGIANLTATNIAGQTIVSQQPVFDISFNASTSSSPTNVLTWGGTPPSSITTLYLPFNSTVNDFSGNNIVITNAGAVTINTTNKVFGAGSGNFSTNTTSYLSFPNTTVKPESTSFSWSGWIYPYTNNSYATIFSDGGPSTTGALFIGGEPTGHLYVAIVGGSSIIGNLALPINTWTYCVVTKFGTNISMYQNGVLTGSGSLSQVPLASATNYINSNTGTLMFVGQMDDMVFYNTIISPTVPSQEYITTLQSLIGPGSPSYTTGGFPLISLPFGTSSNGAITTTNNAITTTWTFTDANTNALILQPINMSYVYGGGAIQYLATTTGTGTTSGSYGPITINVVSNPYFTYSSTIQAVNGTPINIILTPLSGVNSQTYFQPVTRQISLYDANQNPIVGAVINATVTGSTLPANTNWLVTMYGMSSQAAIQALSTQFPQVGTTGVDGSTTFTMVPSLDYNLAILNPDGTTYNVANLYPAQAQYAITEFGYNNLNKTTPQFTGQTTNSTLFATVNNTNSSLVNFGMIYVDSSGASSTVTFTIVNNSDGQIIYQNTQPVFGTISVSDGYVIQNVAGNAYYESFNATTTNGIFQEGVGVTMQGPNGVLVDLGLTGSQRIYYQWIVVAVLILIAAMASQRNTTLFAILLPIFTGLFMWFGWTGSMSSPLLGIVTVTLFIGIMAYMKQKLHEKFGIGGPGTMILNIIAFLIIFQFSVGLVNGMGLFYVNASVSPTQFAPFVMSTQMNAANGIGGINSSLVSASLDLASMMISACVAFFNMVIIPLVAFGTIIFTSFPILRQSTQGILLVSGIQIAIWLIYLYFIWIVFFKPPPGSTEF